MLLLEELKLIFVGIELFGHEFFLVKEIVVLRLDLDDFFLESQIFVFESLEFGKERTGEVEVHRIF